jgi:peptidoglycan/LPS O-acetylase OafA/YrhL
MTPGLPERDPDREGIGASSTKESKGTFRPDIEGLRAVAVVVVLLYHAGVPAVGGGYVGVDVFFVISGFLITGLLVRELESTGTLSLGRFYSRRAKRLLPLTVVVLGVVAALSWIMLDPVRMEEVSLDIIAAGLYVINWLFARQAVDYFGAGLETSPVQHFWSLAIEEQFYLFWPILLLAVAWWCRRSNRHLRPTLAAAFAVVAVSSFAYGAYVTQVQAGAAYFSTLARGWELALGGALALAPASLLNLPRWMAAALAWAGLAAICLAAYLLGDDTPFPGVAALLPTLGAAAIIAAGLATVSTGPARLLTLAPVRHIGRISYAWYLWHWPPLIFAAAQWGELSVYQGLAVAAASYIPAVVTHRFIERPFLESPTLSRLPSRALALGAACTAASVAMGMLLFFVTPSFQTKPEGEAAGLSELSEGDGPQKRADAVRPNPREAEKNRSAMYDDGCHLEQPQTELPDAPDCVYGDPSSDTTVVLFGDSHAMHWFPALHKLANERGWRLVGLSKSSCTPAEASIYNGSLRREYRECDEWRDKALERIVEEEPDLVVTSGITTYSVMEDGERMGREDGTETLREGLVSTLEKLRDTGARVAVMEDIAHPDKDIPECVSRSLDNLRECAIPKDRAYDFPKLNTQAAEEVDGARAIDPEPVLCREETCPAVVGDVLVYRNGAHLTPAYARVLAPWLGERLPDPRGSRQ